MKFVAETESHFFVNSHIPNMVTPMGCELTKLCLRLKRFVLTLECLGNPLLCVWVCVHNGRGWLQR